MDNCVEIYDVYSGQWIQSIACRKMRPLNPQASLSMYCSDSDTKRLIFLSNPLNSTDTDHIIDMPQQIDELTSRRHLVKKNKYQFQFKLHDENLKSKMKDPSQRAKLISGPVLNSFQHVSHLGPEHAGFHLTKLKSLSPQPSSSDMIGDNAISEEKDTAPSPSNSIRSGTSSDFSHSPSEAKKSYDL